MDAQIQKAVDCYNAGATVLHVHVREEDGKGSKRLSKFNQLLAGIRKACPEMILQVGGSISLFESKSAAEDAHKKALSWIKSNLADLTDGEPEVMAGEVLAAVTAQGATGGRASAA